MKAFKEIRCLVIDDDDGDFFLAEDALSDIAARPPIAEWAPNYTQAETMLAEGEFNVCLVDYRIGPDNGLEFVRRMIAKGCRVPMIVLTGMSDPEIDEEAAISNATQRRRNADEAMNVGALLGLPDLVSDLTGISLDPGADLSSSSASSGDGSVRRNEEITLRLAATVTDVLPNGHFVIVGNQEVRVNFELRDLRVHGVIRPEDISRANEITYDKIADARVSYGGRGQITDVQQPRYGQQIADIILPF